MRMRFRYLYLNYVLPAGPISTSFGILQSENYIILTARPRRSVVYVRSCVGRLRWNPSLQWRAVFEVPHLQKPLGCKCRRGNAVRVVRSSSDAKERHCRPCTQEDISCFARYFWPTSCLRAISGRSETEVL